MTFFQAWFESLIGVVTTYGLRKVSLALGQKFSGTEVFEGQNCGLSDELTRAWSLLRRRPDLPGIPLESEDQQLEYKQNC
jgi:hypothetical protein